MKRAIAAFCGTVLGALAMALPVEAFPIAPDWNTVSVSTTPTPVLLRRGFYVVGGVYYYNGYRGYVRVRPGYRYYNGYWFPAAAFAAGAAAATIAPVAPGPVVRREAAHIRWCYERYISYPTGTTATSPSAVLASNAGHPTVDARPTTPRGSRLPLSRRRGCDRRQAVATADRRRRAGRRCPVSGEIPPWTPPRGSKANAPMAG